MSIEMRKSFGFILPLAFAFILSCQSNGTEPNYSIIPYVEFRDLKLGQGGSAQPDTLTLKFYLRDGDFDLGRDYGDTIPPFNPIFVINKVNGQFIPVTSMPADHTNLIVYRDRKTIDTLPPLNCKNWTQTFHSYALSDTVYHIANPNYWNLTVDLFSKGSQDWTYFDPVKVFLFPGCNPNGFKTVFPILPFKSFGPFKYQLISSKEGILTYTISSYGLRFLFSGKKVKLKFSIQDRALHRSNVVETTEIQL
jgi:hypothetical protein